MSRVFRFWVGFQFTIILLIGARSLFADELAGSRPHIILVMADDQGMGDLSCMGYTVLRTPHIDEFFNQSTSFTEFHVSPNAKLIIVTTTPVPTGAEGRTQGDAIRYNTAALEALKQYPQVKVNDLYELTLPNQKRW